MRGLRARGWLALVIGITAAVAAAGSSALSVDAAVQAPQYTVTNLGTLGGSFCAGFTGQNSFATALNAGGAAAGGSCKFVDFFQPVISAVRWSSSSIGDLGSAGAAHGINDAGDVVGGSGNPDFEASGVAFLWRDGSLTSLDAVLGGFSRAYDINNEGQVVGLRGTPPAIDRWRSFLYDTTTGGVVDLGTLGGTFRSTATAVNDAGQVAGWASLPDENTFHAFLWKNGAMTDLGTLGSQSFGRGINSLGQVVGDSWLSSGGAHAFLYSSGSMRDLGALGGTFSIAWGIDDRGRVVGSSGTPAAGQHAFVWSSGVMRDLNDLIAADSGWVLTEARAINNSGQIVGTGRFGGDARAFLLTPTGVDTMPPVLTVPSGITAEAASSAGSAVSYEASAVDDVDGSVTASCTPSTGSTFPLGTTTVECTATDTSGNSASAGFAVTVRDTTPPVITTPGNLSRGATGPGGVTVTYTVSATDEVNGSVLVACTPPTGSTFAIGTTTVNCAAKDTAGNEASASFSVRVKGAGEQLDDLLAAVTGIGPGSSIADKVRDVQSALSKGAGAKACDALGAFVNQVKAQSGKTLSSEQEATLVAAADRIRAVLSC